MATTTEVAGARVAPADPEPPTRPCARRPRVAARVSASRPGNEVNRLTPRTAAITATAAATTPATTTSALAGADLSIRPGRGPNNMSAARRRGDDGLTPRTQGPNRGVRLLAVASLDDVDLSVKLSKAAGLKRLQSAQRRLLALRLQAGGQIGDGRAGPAAVRAVRGVGRVGQGRSDSQADRAAGPSARQCGAVRRADRAGEAPSLPVAFLAGAARVGRDGGDGPVLVRARAGRARRGIRDQARVAARVRRDRLVRARPRPTRAWCS